MYGGQFLRGKRGEGRATQMLTVGTLKASSTKSLYPEINRLTVSVPCIFAPHHSTYRWYGPNFVRPYETYEIINHLSSPSLYIILCGSAPPLRQMFPPDVKQGGPLDFVAFLSGYFFCFSSPSAYNQVIN